MAKAVLGIIGGSGIYDLPGLENVREERIASPWGEPSGALRIGEIAGLPVVFLPRHDKGHRLSPSDINYRANIDVLKRAGVTDLVSLSACGSFKEELPPGTFVLVDQFVDRTHKRESSFFGKGCVAHVSMAHPVSPRLRIHLAAAADAEGIQAMRGGTYVCMEGPQFSTLAESLTYKELGYSVIGMTNMPEAKLAREAELCYATVAMVTDFDCWHPDHDAVTVQDIIKVLTPTPRRPSGLVARLAQDFPREHEPCPIGSDRALDTALITAPEARDPELLKKLDAVAGRVLKVDRHRAHRRGPRRAQRSVGRRLGQGRSRDRAGPGGGSTRCHPWTERLQPHRCRLPHAQGAGGEGRDRRTPSARAGGLAEVRHLRAAGTLPAEPHWRHRGGIDVHRWSHASRPRARCIDGSPVLDIKPYISGFAPRGAVREPIG